jgi:hypothetical protein
VLDPGEPGRPHRVGAAGGPDRSCTSSVGSSAVHRSRCRRSDHGTCSNIVRRTRGSFRRSRRMGRSDSSIGTTATRSSPRNGVVVTESETLPVTIAVLAGSPAGVGQDRTRSSRQRPLPRHRQPSAEPVRVEFRQHWRTCTSPPVSHRRSAVTHHVSRGREPIVDVTAATQKNLFASVRSVRPGRPGVRLSRRPGRSPSRSARGRGYPTPSRSRRS